MHIVLLGIVKALGGVLLGLLMDLLTGKTLRVLLYRPLAWLSSKTGSTVDDIIVKDIRTDWKITDEDLGEKK